MRKKYLADDEILGLVDAFERAAVPREEWKHGEHLAVALYYLTKFNSDEATNVMRAGILNLARNGFNVDLTKEMPYHETITVFWMRTLSGFLESRRHFSLTDNANAVAEHFDTAYPLQFYSRELLFSDKARAEYVEPDLADQYGATETLRSSATQSAASVEVSK